VTVAQSVFYATTSFGLMRPDTDIDDMVRIVTSFVNEQVTSMDEWCDKLSNSFPETD